MLAEKAERAEQKRLSRPAKRSTAERGYGYRHQLRRKALLPGAIGTDCPICGLVMTADQRLEVDHSVPLRYDPKSVGDRVVHDACNAGWHRQGPATGPRDAKSTKQVCPVCEQVFRVKPSHRHLTCSRECGWVLRKARQAA